MITRSVGVLFGLFLVGMLVIIPVRAQDGTRAFDNGQTVSGAFLDYYESSNDPMLIFGYPISGEIYDAQSGSTLQYFQRALFILKDNKVNLAPLGQQSYKPGAQLADLPNKATSCRRFPATGNSVCYSFLKFYDDNQGSQFLGNPISEVEVQDGQRYVQYFDNGRLEWQPENEAGERVVVADLGKIEYDRYLHNPTNTENHIVGMSNGLQLSTFVTQALVPANSRQTVYIIVQDGQYKPIAGVSPVVTVYYPDGEQDDVRAPVTDDNGISRIDFTVRDQPIQQVVRVEVHSAYLGAKSSAASWFRIWW